MQNKGLLTLGIALVLIGFIKPSLTMDFLKPSPTVAENYVIDAPSDQTLLQSAKSITEILNESDDSTKYSDCLKLSLLYADLATLIELDNEDMVIKDTASIRQANSLAGKMLRLNIKNKYPGLAEAARELLTEAIGEDDVSLDDEMRENSANAFRALSYAFYEGSK